jgi:hypothetical protein
VPWQARWAEVSNKVFAVTANASTHLLGSRKVDIAHLRARLTQLESGVTVAAFTKFNQSFKNVGQQVMHSISAAAPADAVLAVGKVLTQMSKHSWVPTKIQLPHLFGKDRAAQVEILFAGAKQIWQRVHTNLAWLERAQAGDAPPLGCEEMVNFFQLLHSVEIEDEQEDADQKKEPVSLKPASVPEPKKTPTPVPFKLLSEFMPGLQELKEHVVSIVNMAINTVVTAQVGGMHDFLHVSLQSAIGVDMVGDGWPDEVSFDFRQPCVAYLLPQVDKVMMTVKDCQYDLADICIVGMIFPLVKTAVNSRRLFDDSKKLQSMTGSVNNQLAGKPKESDKSSNAARLH